MRKFRSFLYRAMPGHALPLHAFWYWLRAVEPEIRLLPALCEADEISIDVGAHYGIYSYFMARYSRTVLAFEPNPILAGLLMRRVDSGIVVRQSAVSDHCGQAELVVPMSGHEPQTALGSIGLRNDSCAAMRISVTCVRLDDVCSGAGRVGFMKVDVEGHELCVVKGSIKVIERYQPTILIEAENRHRADAVSSLQLLLDSYGYKGYFLDNKRLRSIDCFEPSVHQSIEPHNSRKYVNNFIFVARPSVMHKLSAWL